MPTTTYFESSITNKDVARVAAKLRKSALAAENTLPVMQRIYLDILRINGIQFRSKGRRGGGSWRGLQPRTILRKGNTKILLTSGSNPGYSRVGGETNADTLFKSVVEINAPYQIKQITNRRVVVGTTRPGAHAHQFGYAKKNIPARPFLVITISDLGRWDRMFLRHVTRPFSELTLNWKP